MPTDDHEQPEVDEQHRQRRGAGARARLAIIFTIGLRISAITAADGEDEQDRPGARASAQSAEQRRAGSTTSWIQRGTTTGRAARESALGWGGDVGWLTQRSSRFDSMRDGMRLLFVGDVVGGIGRRTLLALLPELREELRAGLRRGQRRERRRRAGHHAEDGRRDLRRRAST